MGGTNYSSSLFSKRRENHWKDICVNHYTVFVDKIVSLDVVKHDIEIFGGRVIQRFGVLHGFIVDAPDGAIEFIKRIQFVKWVEPTYNLKSLRGH